MILIFFTFFRTLVPWDNLNIWQWFNVNMKRCLTVKFIVNRWTPKCTTKINETRNLIDNHHAYCQWTDKQIWEQVRELNHRTLLISSGHKTFLFDIRDWSESDTWDGRMFPPWIEDAQLTAEDRRLRLEVGPRLQVCHLQHIYLILYFPSLRFLQTLLYFVLE